MATKKDKNSLYYKDKLLVRSGNRIYYGDPQDKYIVLFNIEDTQHFKGIDISTKVTIELSTNEGSRSKIIKQAKRDGLFKAIDVGAFWLQDALATH